MPRRQLFKYIFIISAGLGITFYAFHSINAERLEENKARMEQAKARAELKVKEEFNKIHLLVESLVYIFHTDSIVTQDEFNVFTTPYMDRLSGITAIAWSPRITNVKILEDSNTIETPEGALTITETDTGNNLVSSGPKNYYYPVTLLNPLPEQQEVLGYDLSSDERRNQAVMRTVNTQKISFTAPIMLVPPNRDAPGFLAMKAVLSADSSEVKGLAMSVYRADTFINRTLRNELELLDVKLFEEGQEVVLYDSLGSEPREFSSEIVLNAGQREWTLVLSPKPWLLSFPHRRSAYFILMLGLVSTFLLFYLARQRDSNEQGLEKKVAFRTKQLELYIKQKDNLLREVHHRVKNNLQITSSLLNLQKRSLTDPVALDALNSSQDRIRAIALIHEKIYQHEGIDAVNLRNYLEDLIAHHRKISPHVHYKIECGEYYISLDDAVPLALIISELVSNALKHAFSEDSKDNILRIAVTELEDHSYSIRIEDNGKGLDKALNLAKPSGLGFEIIKKLCRQINADLHHTSDTQGTKFHLSFAPKIQKELEPI